MDLNSSTSSRARTPSREFAAPKIVRRLAVRRRAWLSRPGRTDQGKRTELRAKDNTRSVSIPFWREGGYQRGLRGRRLTECFRAYVVREQALKGHHDEDRKEKTSEESQSDGYDDVKRRCYNIEFPKTVITQLETG